MSLTDRLVIGGGGGGAGAGPAYGGSGGGMLSAVTVNMFF